ncbi:MAG: hypothetical protein JWQ33_2787 [Ramlibacter sp.]|nr:hypothetical protein [Ramlibacter sp.]
MKLPSPPEAADSPLASACAALWSATLFLMTAYMQTPAPAHRFLLARRISANFSTLAQQDVFSVSSRESFALLQQRWQANAQRLAQPGTPQGRWGRAAGLRTTAQRAL